MGSTEIGKRIKAARGQVKQEDFAQTVGVSRGTISRWEKGETFPDACEIQKICEICDVDPAWLIIGNKLENNASRFDNLSSTTPDESKEIGTGREKQHEAVRKVVLETPNRKPTIGLFFILSLFFLSFLHVSNDLTIQKFSAVIALCCGVICYFYIAMHYIEGKRSIISPKLCEV